MASQAQRQAARKNITKAKRTRTVKRVVARAKRANARAKRATTIRMKKTKQTLKNLLPKRIRTVLAKQATKVAKELHTS